MSSGILHVNDAVPFNPKGTERSRAQQFAAHGLDGVPPDSLYLHGWNDIQAVFLLTAEEHPATFSG
jgi:hypothetical protein